MTEFLCLEELVVFFLFDSQFRKLYQKGASKFGSFGITIVKSSTQHKYLCLDTAIFCDFFLSMKCLKNVHDLGLQDSFSGIHRKEFFIIMSSKREKYICFWTIHIILILFIMFCTEV